MIALAASVEGPGFGAGLKTIGAQVDSPAALEGLRRIGVDYGQGFGIARPEPLEDAVARL